jgi:hypothetical protein
MQLPFLNYLLFQEMKCNVSGDKLQLKVAAVRFVKNIESNRF